MKHFVDVFDHAMQICKAMKKGILLTTKANGKVNTMTIGWGMLGVQWNKPIFIALVRESRYTRKLLDAGQEFTVNIPVGEIDSKILGYCGTKSGADTDKISDMKLTLEDPESVSVPGIRELPLTLECKVLYQQLQDLSGIPEDILQRFYPQNVDSSFSGSNRDAHIAYYAEILNAYIIED